MRVLNNGFFSLWNDNSVMNCVDLLQSGQIKSAMNSFIQRFKEHIAVKFTPARGKPMRCVALMKVVGPLVEQAKEWRSRHDELSGARTTTSSGAGASNDHSSGMLGGSSVVERSVGDDLRVRTEGGRRSCCCQEAESGLNIQVFRLSKSAQNNLVNSCVIPEYRTQDFVLFCSSISFCFQSCNSCSGMVCRAKMDCTGACRVWSMGFLLATEREIASQFCFALITYTLVCVIVGAL
jgi:hypothetical protein